MYFAPVCSAENLIRPIGRDGPIRPLFHVNPGGFGRFAESGTTPASELRANPPMSDNLLRRPSTGVLLSTVSFQVAVTHLRFRRSEAQRPAMGVAIEVPLKALYFHRGPYSNLHAGCRHMDFELVHV